ncbi:MAG: hypothetical protein KBS38_04430 [Bacteroidales bacterium]|nr:hypothetical protein [Candidatus Cacconaster caballi]
MKLMTLIVAMLMMLPVDTDGAERYWDIVLDNYEALCNACMEKKSKNEIHRLSKNLNELLKHKEGKMDRTQRERFYSIQNRYRGFITISGTSFSETEIPRIVAVDTVRRYEYIQVTDTVFVKEIIGSIELNQKVSNKDTVYHIIQYQGPVTIQPSNVPVPEVVASDVSAPEQKNDVRPVVKEDPVRKLNAVRPSVFITGNLSIGPALSYGATVGGVKKFGGYIGFHSNFCKTVAGYSCTSDGFTKGSRIMANGAKTYGRLAVTAGVCYEINKWLILSAGAGYGSSNCFWQDIDGTWMNVSDISVKGVEVEAGGIFHFGLLGISIGACTTSFKNAGLKAGLGFAF